MKYCITITPHEGLCLTLQTRAQMADIVIQYSIPEMVTDRRRGVTVQTLRLLAILLNLETETAETFEL